MKKNIFITLALCSAFVVSCKKEAFNDGSGKENGDGRGEYTYTIKGIIDDGGEEAKLGIGVDGSKYFGKWEEGDQVVIYEVVSSQADRKWITDAPIAVSDISKDGKSANIRFNTDYPGTTKCRAFYYTAGMEDLIYGQGNLPAVQTQKGTGLENTSLKKYAFMYTTSDATIESKMADPVKYCTFYHALSYVNISFKSSFFEGWNVDKIVLKNENGTNLTSSKYNVDCSVAPQPTDTRSSSVTALYGDKSTGITLSFDNPVTLSSAPQNAWMVALPTHLKIKDVVSTDPELHSVYFQISKGGRTEYAKIRFKTCLKGGTVKELKVGEIVEADILNDYKEIYDAGLDIPIGDMVVNKTTHPTATVKTPTQLVASGGMAKGLIFVDDKEGETVTLSGSNPNISGNGELIVVGRYANMGKQTNLRGRSIRIIKDAKFLNVKFTCIGGETMFERNSTQQGVNSLYLVDCYLDMATEATPLRAVIRSRSSNSGNIADPFSKIYVDNCVIKMGTLNTDKKAKPFYRLNSSVESETPPAERSLTINNCVFFCETCVNASFIYCGDNITDPDITYKFTGNTLVNIMSGPIVRLAKAPLDAIVSDKDLVYASDQLEKGADASTQPKFHYNSGMESASVGTVSNCYLAWDNMWDTTVKDWTSYGNEKINNKAVHGQGSPFLSSDYVNGYFPVNTAVVTNGAGASYDTKKYFTWTTAE